jgi:F1F0 ATPase subunit 2
MNEAVILTLSLGSGTLFGFFFYGGLWWTVRAALRSGRPAVWFLSSMILRTGITMLGFYWVGGGHWQRMVACLVGFFAGRVLVTWFTRVPAEACHATHT